MSVLLHIIVTYIKENIITKLQKLYNAPRNPRTAAINRPHYLWKNLFARAIYSSRAKYSLKGLITMPRIYIKQVRIYHWKFCIIFFFLIRMNKTEVFQFLIIYIQIRFMFVYIAQNNTFNLFISIFTTFDVLFQVTLIPPGYI